MKKAAEQQNKKFNEIKYEENDWVFYQEKDKKAWHGPVRVHAHRDRDVFVFTNGDLKKIADCRIQPYRIQSQIDTSDKGYSATETGIGEINSEDERDLSDPKPSTERIEGPKTISRSKSEKENEARKDVIRAFWITKQNSKCFDPFTIYVVEVPSKDHNTPEVIDAKEKEIKNLKDFDTFEEIEDEGQKKVGS